MNRPTLKETVGTSLNASNLSSDSRTERPLDRVVALSRADNFGAALWRLKVGGDLRVLKRAAILLAHRAREAGMSDWKLESSRKPALLLRICERLINEWLQDKCPKCRGRGRTGIGKGKVARNMTDCAICSGAGRAPHIGNITAALLATGEAVEIATIPCTACGGRGRVPRETQIQKASPGRVCGACEGSGRARTNGAERARVVGVSTKSYWKTWHRRFEDLRRLIAEADGEAVEAVRTALRGPRRYSWRAPP